MVGGGSKVIFLPSSGCAVECLAYFLFCFEWSQVSHTQGRNHTYILPRVRKTKQREDPITGGVFVYLNFREKSAGELTAFTCYQTVLGRLLNLSHTLYFF